MCRRPLLSPPTGLEPVISRSIAADMFTATGSPTQAVIDAMKDALDADAPLDALITGVYGHLSEVARTSYPYVVLGRRHRRNDGGAMQVAGGQVTVDLDIWSDHKGPSKAHAICSRIVEILERRDLALEGFTLIKGSLTCEFEDVFDEPDEDKPGSRLYHGVQRWICETHESI